MFSEYNADANPEKVRQEGLEKLREEQQRHDEAMRKLQEQCEEEKTKLESRRRNQRKWFGNFAMKQANTFGPTSSTVGDMFSCAGDERKGYSGRPVSTASVDTYGCAGDSPGSCLIIWNEKFCNETDAGLISQDFLNLGFEVQLKKNMSQRDIWNHFETVGGARYHAKKCFILFFISKGTQQYIKSADEQKTELEKIVDFFHPTNAIGLRRTLKILFFQCNLENHRKKALELKETPFAPNYDDAFVLSSTHSRFLPTMRDFLRKGFVGEFQQVMSDVADELVRGSTAYETVIMESTLRRQLYFGME